MFEDWKRTSAEETLEATWWVFDQEEGMDAVMEQAGKSLDEMCDSLKVHPFQDRQGKDRLFLARYEFPRYEEDFQHPQGVFLEEALGFVDFLGGFPLECVEMLVLVGEHSSKPDTVAVKEGMGAAPPVPDKFFEWPEADRILLNTCYLAASNVKWWAKNLPGEPEPKNLHWWLRVNLGDPKAKFPVPGEFLALGVRLMPDAPWGQQKSSPFLYSGNWMDTVYYTGGVVKEVLEPDEATPYPRYRVTWRKFEVEARPSDFAEYRAGDRVAILKDVSTEKPSQLWKDEDATAFDKDTWVIAPVSFYGLDRED